MYTAATERERVTLPAQRRHGIACVELAVLAPFLGLFLVGMFEIGRACLVAEALENAARKGCQAGINNGKSYTDVIADVNNILSDNNLVTTNVVTSVGVATCSSSTSNPPTWGSFTAATANNNYTPKKFDLVAVQVTIPAADVLYFNSFFLKNMNIRSSKVVLMRVS